MPNYGVTGNGEITEAMKLQYRQTVTLLTQQTQSVLSGYVRRESITGQKTAFDRIGPVEAVKRTGRHADTPLIGTPFDRRWVDASPWDWADMIDNPDKIRTLVDPTGQYVQNAVAAFNRVKDRVIIEAAFANAWAGQNGDIAVPFPATQTIVANATIAKPAGDGDAKGLTIEKLRLARKMFRRADVPASTPLYCVISAEQLDNLLGTTEVTNADYNTVRALVNGDVNSFMGFRFISSELLPIENETRDILCFAEGGLLLGVATDTTVEIGKRPDKNYSTQVYAGMDIGAVRMEECRVIKIQCKEA